MGSTRWSDDHYHHNKARRDATGEDAFAYNAAIDRGEAVARVHEKMNPKSVKLRESRDSDAHPTSRAVAVLFDVTGSMNTVPRILQENLPKLMGLLIRKGYLDHPQIQIGAIGDATCDTAPLQVGQFESGIEIEEDLGKLYLEGGGGGQVTESYELAMYMTARHTAIDCFEKRGEKGYLFIIGDEAAYGKVKRSEVAAVVGDKIQADIPIGEMLEELRQKWEVFFVVPRMTQHWDNKAVQRFWVNLLGQNVLRLEEPAGVCELIASTIGLLEGKIDLDHLADDLASEGATASVGRAVNKSLEDVAAKRAATGKAAVPTSGAPSGVATL